MIPIKKTGCSFWAKIGLKIANKFKNYFFLGDFSIFLRKMKNRFKDKGFPYILDSIGIVQSKKISGAFGQNLGAKSGQKLPKNLKEDTCESFLQLG